MTRWLWLSLVLFTACVHNLYRWFDGGSGWWLYSALSFFLSALLLAWFTPTKPSVDRRREQFLEALRGCGLDDSQYQWLKAHWDIRFGEDYVFPLHPDQQAVVKSLERPQTPEERLQELRGKFDTVQSDFRVAEMEGDSSSMLKLGREARRLAQEISCVQTDIKVRQLALKRLGWKVEG